VSFAATLGLWREAVAPHALNHVLTGLQVPLLSWLPGWDFGLLLDPLSLVWTLIITGVGFLIHVYSIGYMDGDRAFARFFAYMNFFVFAMLTLVLSDNVVGLLVGWGLVGLASYFLIGFWFYKPTAVSAARKAFVMNVVGDVAIMFAIFLIVRDIGSIAYADIFGKFLVLGSSSPHAVFWICLGLFIGCAAKSAQIPLHTWLPDAMEGPTPVSALIHAATMVTAGVYLIARFAPLWSSSPDAQELTGAIGGLTALAGAILGCAQWDIKRILAYSTMSQIGYMIMGVGVGAYDAGVFHFLTHAFFKAQLFLGAGIVIHALANEQDVRRMGGLRKTLPFAFVAMLTGVLAISGVPGFSGFFSKDAVVYGALETGHPWLYAIGVITAGITAYYMFRLLFVTFFGAYRGEVDPSDLGIRHPELAGTATTASSSGHHSEEEEPHHHAPSWLMSGPVAVLILPTIFIGFLDLGANAPWKRLFAGFFPRGNELSATVASAPLVSETLSTVIVFAVVVIGFAVAYVRYGASPALREAIARLRTETIRMPGVLVNAYYFDAAYEALLVRPAYALGRWFVRVVDPHGIDAGVREVAISSQWLGHLFRSFQTGLVRAYALTIAVGVVCFVAYYAFAFTGGGR
jgi:NADH-quinone oxidoreductase subunit L